MDMDNMQIVFFPKKEKKERGVVNDVFDIDHARTYNYHYDLAHFAFGHEDERAEATKDSIRIGRQWVITNDFEKLDAEIKRISYSALGTFLAVVGEKDKCGFVRIYTADAKGKLLLYDEHIMRSCDYQCMTGVDFFSDTKLAVSDNKGYIHKYHIT
jgi:hypothetical protein